MEECNHKSLALVEVGFADPNSLIKSSLTLRCVNPWPVIAGGKVKVG